MANRATRNSKGPTSGSHDQHDGLAKIEKVPTEIIDKIVHCLSTADIASVSYTSKSLSAQCQGHLRFTCKATRADKYPRLSQLLAYVIEHPNRRSIIEGLHLGDRDRSKAGNDIPTIPLKEAELENVMEEMDSMQFPKDKIESWKKDVKRGDMDAVAALLVVLLPNLRVFVLNGIYSSQYNHLSMAFDIICPQRQSPKQALTFHLTYHQSLSSNILYFFCLPNLKAMSLTLDTLSDDWPETHEGPSPGLTSLDLNALNETTAGPLLKTLTSLERLDWCIHHQEGESEEYDVSDVETVLQPLANTLTELHVSDEGDTSIQVFGTIENWRSFEKMKILAIPWIFMADFAQEGQLMVMNGLPPTLEDLRVTRGTYDADLLELNMGDIFTALQQWLDRGEAPLGQSLRSVSLELWNGDEEEEEDEEDDPKILESLTLPARLGMTMDIEFDKGDESTDVTFTFHRKAT